MKCIQSKGLLLFVLFTCVLQHQACRAGTIYSIAYGSAIYAVSSTNGASINYFGGNENLGQPNGMAVDTNGFLYVAYTSSNTIIRYTPTGQSIYTTQATNAYALAFDNAGTMYSANNDGTISKFSPNGSASVYATLPAVASGLVFDRPNTLYANLGGNAIESVSTNGAVSTFATIGEPLQWPSGLAIDANGNLFAMAWHYSSVPGSNSYPLITKISNTGVVSDFFDFSAIAQVQPVFNAAGPVIDESNNVYCSVQIGEHDGVLQIVAANGTALGTFYFLPAFDNGGTFMAYSPFNVPLSDLPDTPTIIRQPQSQTVGAGSTVTFAVYAEIAPFTYQWYFNAKNLIPGATNAILVIGNVQGQQSGSYSVVVSNSAGSTNSQPAYLSVLPSLTINMVPAISLFGTVGASYNIQYINAVGPTNAPWISLATVTLTNSPQFYPDYSAIGQPQRFYRAVQLP